MPSPLVQLVRELKAGNSVEQTPDGPKEWANRTAGKLERMQELDAELSAVPLPVVLTTGRIFRDVMGRLGEVLCARLRDAWEPAAREALKYEEDNDNREILVMMLGLGGSPTPAEVEAATTEVEARQDAAIREAHAQAGAARKAAAALKTTTQAATGSTKPTSPAKTGSATTRVAEVYVRRRPRPVVAPSMTRTSSRRTRSGEDEDDEVAASPSAKRARLGKGKGKATANDDDEEEEANVADELEGDVDEDAGDDDTGSEEEVDELASTTATGPQNTAATAKRIAEQARLADYRQARGDDLIFVGARRCDTCIARGHNECRVARGEGKCRFCRGSKKKCSGPKVSGPRKSGPPPSLTVQEVEESSPARTKKVAPTPTAKSTRVKRKSGPGGQAMIVDTDKGTAAAQAQPPTETTPRTETRLRRRETIRSSSFAPNIVPEPSQTEPEAVAPPPTAAEEPMEVGAPLVEGPSVPSSTVPQPQWAPPMLADDSEAYWRQVTDSLTATVDGAIRNAGPSSLARTQSGVIALHSIATAAQRATTAAPILAASDEVASSRLAFSRVLADALGFIRLAVAARRLSCEAETRFTKVKRDAAARASAPGGSAAAEAGPSVQGPRTRDGKGRMTEAETDEESGGDEAGTDGEGEGDGGAAASGTAGNA